MFLRFFYKNLISGLFRFLGFCKKTLKNHFYSPAFLIILIVVFLVPHTRLSWLEPVLLCTLSLCTSHWSLYHCSTHTDWQRWSSGHQHLRRV